MPRRVLGYSLGWLGGLGILVDKKSQLGATIYQPLELSHPRTVLCMYPDRPIHSSSVPGDFGMENTWPGPQPRHGIPFTSDSHSTASHSQNATRPEGNAAILSCSCFLCSEARRYEAPPWRAVEHQEQWPPIGRAVPYANQNLGIDNTTQTRIVAPHVPQNQENGDYPPPQIVAKPIRAQSSAGLEQARALDMPAKEDLKHLAWRYVNNAESVVSAVHFEPGQSGQLQVFIMVEIDHIL
ncbi:hypothetical protein BC826DRAFT_38161 [Russula brevipes]|nr:hypothetical protein BC826DRAFT_38161 [Russula brevipes]